MIEKLNSEIIKLKEENFKLLQQKPNMEEYNSLDEAKKQIAEEFNKLNEKHTIVESNMQILMQKEMQVLKKEEEINQIITNYNNILNISTYQVTIDTRFLDNHSESYRYQLEEPIDRVTQLELISYNVPFTKYNINKYNNSLKYKIEGDDDDYEIKLEEGVYDIDLLLENLNNLCDSIIFENDFKQYITIKHSEETNFDLIPTNLLTSVLGFTEKTYKESNTYKADKIFELRNDNLYKFTHYKCCKW